MNSDDVKKTSIIDDALLYESFGFSVIPLGEISTGIDGKKKINFLMGWKKAQISRATPNEIKEWSCENLGVVTGRISGILVLDLDTYKENYNRDLERSFNLPITPTSQTANGGKQCFFRLPDGLEIKNEVSIGNKGSGIDIRANGGMVVVPPSKTAYGEYTWLISPADAPFAEVPPNLLKLIRGDKNMVLKPKKKLPDLVNLKEGEGRNNAVASFVGKLICLLNPEDWDSQVWPMVISINNTYKPPLQMRELKTIYESITKIEKKRRSEFQEPKEDSSFTPAISHAELITKEFPAIRFTIDPFFEQGTVNMVSAPPNTWKSWFLFLFAERIATGQPLMDRFNTEKTNVMIVNEEDSARLVQDRLKLLEINEISLPIFYRISYGSKLKKAFVQDLIQEAKEKNIGVIMFDSLRAIHEADENDSKEMQEVMDLLKEIARANITVIFTHHHKKKNPNGKNDDAEMARGSTAINAAISGHISIEEVNDTDARYLTVKHLKSKVGEKEQPFDVGIQIDDSIIFTYLGKHLPKLKVLTQAKEGILMVLEEKKIWLGRKDFVDLKIAGQSTIKLALKDLVADKKIKIIDRSDADRNGFEIFNPTGKSNEKLYRIEIEDELMSESRDIFSFED